MRYTYFLFFIFFLLSSCELEKISTDDMVLKSELCGKSFTYIVEKVAINPSVQTPDEIIHDSNYVLINEEKIFTVVFTHNCEEIEIYPINAQGIVQSENIDKLTYAISSGLFAGGRFSVFRKNCQLEAEFTIFGSGIPVVESYKGFLVLISND